jgi:Rrf2 family protein
MCVGTTSTAVGKAASQSGGPPHRFRRLKLTEKYSIADDASMKFTAQEEYGLRCLLAIARNSAGFATIGEIAESESLSSAYVAKLMRILRQGGLVDSTRGQNGGYALARAPEKIDMAEVVAALGGRLYSQDFCANHAGTAVTCVHGGDCSIRSLWTVLDHMVDRALRRMTLRDLLCSEPVAAHRVELAFPARGPRIVHQV